MKTFLLSFTLEQNFAMVAGAFFVGAIVYFVMDELKTGDQNV